MASTQQLEKTPSGGPQDRAEGPSRMNGTGQTYLLGLGEVVAGASRTFQSPCTSELFCEFPQQHLSRSVKGASERERPSNLPVYTF